jgi:hypothetical protein
VALIAGRADDRRTRARAAGLTDVRGRAEIAVVAGLTRGHDVVPAGDGQPLTVTVTLYTPVAAAVAAGIAGFC